MARPVFDESLPKRLAVSDHRVEMVRPTDRPRAMDHPRNGVLPGRATRVRCSCEAELSERHALASERYKLVKAQQCALGKMRRYLVRAREELVSATERQS